MAVEELFQAAVQARERARATFSHFKVGAAVEDETGTIYSGCNIENASYGLTLCAERVAIFKAISEGSKSFRHVLVVTDSETPSSPCGACRQILWEFCGNVEITMANLAGKQETIRLQQLFPRPFDVADL